MDSSIFHDLSAGVEPGSAEAMEALGAAVAAEIPENFVLTLSGDLGSGKTTFARGFAKGLHIHQAVTSPTYNIYNIYSGRRQLIHMDAYRLNSAADMEELMLEEFLQPPWNLVLEWPEKITDWLADQSQYNLNFEVVNENCRRVMLSPTRL